MKKKHVILGRFPFSLAGLGFLAFLIAPLPALSKKPMFPTLPLPGPPPPLQDHKYWQEQGKEFAALTNEKWAFERWTGNDAPYAAARARVEREANSGLPPLTLVARYQSRAKAEPNNSLAQFSWAYAVRFADKVLPASKTVSDLRFAAELGLAEAPQPRTYNYDRLHYLLRIQGGGGGGSHFLKNLASRLLAKDPQDFPVLLYQSLIYTQNRDPADRQHGYTLIQGMIKKYPNKPEVYDALGCWYYTEYLFVHNKPDYDQAMAYYQKALNMYPAKSARRDTLPGVMAFLTKRYHQISGS